MNKVTIGTMVAAVVTLLGIGASAAWENHQTNKKVGKSMEELKNATVRDISDSMLREAVSRAADIAVNKYVRDDNESILNRANVKLANDIQSLVKSRYDEVTKDVSDRLASQVAKLDDPERLRRNVREKAEDILAKRFNDDLDDLKRKAEDAFDDANERYENKLEDVVNKFEEKLDDKLAGYSDNLASMKKVYESIEKAFGHRDSRDGNKEIRFTLG